MTDSILDLPLDRDLDPDEFVRAAMRWHFDPETGSPYWLRRAQTLGFDPRRDVTTYADLALFPQTADEMRDIPARDLIPHGYGDAPRVFGVFESGGTTGAPKRVVFMDEWNERTSDWMSLRMDAHDIPRDADWLTILPSGPHLVGMFSRQSTSRRGGIPFAIDMDPRWVKKLIAAGKGADAAAYAGHLLEQAAFILRTQRIGVLMTTPPMLELLARDEELTDLIARRVRAILWAGAHMDDDTRDLLRNEIWPDTTLLGVYGSTMILGCSMERPGLADGEPCTFDPPSPWTTFWVIDPDTRERVAYGQRGQVVMNHVSKGFLLPNNLERDTAIRSQPPDGTTATDSVSTVKPLETFGDQRVIEGVY
ncbi:AMP-binding protein [Streptomyces sp. P1-3]|uniref:AMP-binding protein n=1 Tax=Streptomyces sp. P1-3 TaxID=3421658 RepID=UPI003D362835